eukprot:4804937-Amphidinium_carterae.1
MNASVRPSALTHRIMPHHMPPALERPHVRRHFRASSHWPGTQCPPRTFFQQRSSAWVYGSDWERPFFLRTYRVAMSHRQVPAVRTCLIAMGPMCSHAHTGQASIATTRSEIRGCD